MINFIYLVIICFFVAIMIISFFKFICNKNWIHAFISLFYVFITGLFSYFIFFSRNALLENELEHLLNLMKKGNVFSIITFLLQLGLVVFGVINYIKIIKMKKKNS